MRELLNCLGIFTAPRRACVAVAIWVAFSSGMVLVAGTQAAIEEDLGVSPAMSTAWVAGVWLVWTYWHSVVFGRHRRRLIDRFGPAGAYRHAFVTNIFPGIAIGFSQMLRSAINGESMQHLRGGYPTLARILTTGRPILPMAIAATATAGCLALFVAAWRALGAARVGFAEEFLAPDEFRPVVDGPYRRVRHPLFWSGVGISSSLSLVAGTQSSVFIAICNIVYGLFYNKLEDHRLIAVYGERYAEYARALPPILVGPRGVSTHEPVARVDK